MPAYQASSLRPSLHEICHAKYPNQASASTPALHPVEVPGGLYLVPRLLSAHRQAHGVPPALHCADVPQPLDVVLHQLPRVVLDRHGRQLGRQRRDGPLRQGADLHHGVQAVLGEDPRGFLGSEGVECLEGLLDELLLVEVDS